MCKGFIILVLAVFCPAGEAVGQAAPEGFLARSKELKEEAVRLRRELHRMPEPCLKEAETSAFVADYLKKLGLDVRAGVCGTGVVAVLGGARPSPVVAIRADMDALPVEEKTGLPFSSRNAGLMHACGHDVHVTNALIAARLLSEKADSLPGTVVFIFQPCEEGNPDGGDGGSKRLIASGVLDELKVGAFLGLHVLPSIPAGSVAIGEGPVMAASDRFKVRLVGRSSHGAQPHLGIDAVYAAALAVLELHGLVGRVRDPVDPAVLTVGTIHGGRRANIVADEVVLEGTVRTFTEGTRKAMKEGMARVVKGVEAAWGVRGELEIAEVAPPVVNDPALARICAEAFRRTVGEQAVREAVPLTISEDFGWYAARTPSVFFFLGTGRDEPLHSPAFDVDEAVLATAPALFAGAAWEILSKWRP